MPSSARFPSLDVFMQDEAHLFRRVANHDWPPLPVVNAVLHRVTELRFRCVDLDCDGAIQADEKVLAILPRGRGADFEGVGIAPAAFTIPAARSCARSFMWASLSTPEK